MEQAQDLIMALEFLTKVLLEVPVAVVAREVALVMAAQVCQVKAPMVAAESIPYILVAAAAVVLVLSGKMEPALMVATVVMVLRTLTQVPPSPTATAGAGV